MVKIATANGGPAPAKPSTATAAAAPTKKKATAAVSAPAKPEPAKAAPPAKKKPDASPAAPAPPQKDPPPPPRATATAAVETQRQKPVREAAATLERRVAGEQAENDAAPKATADAAVSKPRAPVSTMPEGLEKDVEFVWNACEADAVQITGSFRNWQERRDLQKRGDAWAVVLKLKPGVYEYKFIVDGNWCYDITLPTVTDDQGNVNNVITV